MRNRALAVAMLAAFGAASMAAQAPAVSVVGAFVSSNVHLGGGNLAGQTSRSGFAAGIAFGLPVDASFQFAPEVVYIEKGTAGSDNGTSGNIKLGYVEGAALFRYSFPTTGSTKPFITAGPTIADHVSCSFTVTVAGNTTSNDCDSSNGIKSTDFGVMFGGGVSMRRFSLSVRYEIGMTNINKDASGDSVKNRALLIMAGLGF